jgi:hypothetical protein
MIFFSDIIPYFIVLFSEIRNDTFNQTESYEIKINDNHAIFEIPGQNENLWW